MNEYELSSIFSRVVMRMPSVGLIKLQVFSNEVLPPMEEGEVCPLFV